MRFIRKDGHIIPIRDKNEIERKGHLRKSIAGSAVSGALTGVAVGDLVKAIVGKKFHPVRFPVVMTAQIAASAVAAHQYNKANKIRKLSPAEEVRFKAAYAITNLGAGFAGAHASFHGRDIARKLSVGGSAAAKNPMSAFRNIRAKQRRSKFKVVD